MRNQWYTSKWAVVSFHILVWLLLFSFPVLFHHDNEHGEGNFDWKKTLFNTINITLNICWVIIFYFNAYFLIPRFLNKRKNSTYLISICLMAIVFLFLVSVALVYLKSGHIGIDFRRDTFFFLLPFLFIWAMSTVYRIVSDKVKTDHLLNERENENLKTELLFLRSQISPHFLFNVLNNMVAMARLKSNSLEASMMKLSGLMRYMLYESDEDKVPLNKEIEYVSSYIDLQRLRFGTDFNIRTNIQEDKAYHFIEPMLLIPFIENAFKHGTGLIQDPAIEVDLKTDEESLELVVRNKYDPQSVEIKDKTSGIGLSNVIRRLNLLYDKRYTLNIEQPEGWFIVTLHLKLK